MKSNYSFLPFVTVLWKRLIWIVLFAIIGGVVGFFVAKSTFVPQYTASSTVEVTRKKGITESNLDRYNTDVNRIGTVQSEIADFGTYEKANQLMQKQYNVSVPAKTIQKHAVVLTKPSSTILAVSMTSPSSEKAVLTVNSIIQAYKIKYAKNDKRLVVRQLSKATKLNTTVTQAPYSQDIKNGAIIGAVLTYLICLIAYFLRKKRVDQYTNKHADRDSSSRGNIKI
ncbi:chain length determinant protein [Secundilactobacillus pentosiphilus]|uniref:Chain length determinant protein n=1 Tax=Secundilactobacillus pentosiphilus TaxID=1714682 RepID=A0A1Z5ITQ4_9LACO|nr:Wzz/FepE/Etk N-terminal domain-containing protein [Secundilactobacillus pentosiphilus]GAX05145.1 chain length determinant protein [Secundilactobacillus pentosiphilus]